MSKEVAVVKKIVLPIIISVLLLFTFVMGMMVIVDTEKKQKEVKSYVIAKCPTCPYEYKKMYCSTKDEVLRLPTNFYCQKCVNPLVWVNE